MRQIDFTVVAGELIKYIGDKENAVIGENVNRIRRLAFRRSSGLVNVFIPRGVLEIGEWAFSDCRQLRELTVHAENPSFCSVDGNLYSLGMERLIRYACGKPDSSFTVPDAVQSIDNGAFEGSCALTRVVIPNGVRAIGELAFLGCSRLTYVAVPETVTEIGSEAFAQCPSLRILDIRGEQLSLLTEGRLAALRGFLLRCDREDVSPRETEAWLELICSEFFSCSDKATGGFSEELPSEELDEFLNIPAFCRLITQYGVLASEELRGLVGRARSIECRAILLEGMAGKINVG